MAVASESYAPSVLVSTEGLPEKDWLEYRRRGIGGSDAAAILGISPFATARDLYYDKLKIVPFDDSESNWVAKKMGHLLEDLVAEIFHVKTGYRIYQIKKMFYHPVHTFMLADIDYFVELPGGRTAILEIKTTNYNAKDHWWSEDGQEIIPLNYEAQGRHYHNGFVGGTAIMGGPLHRTTFFVAFRYKKNARILLRAECGRFDIRRCLSSKRIRVKGCL